jgi:hypothetical protein
VQTHDDEQFEAYLKRFQPIAPEPVATFGVGHSSRRPLSLRTWLAIAAILVVGAVISHIRSTRGVVPNTPTDVAVNVRHAPSEPLTMGSANVWLATTPSFKAALDDLAFRSQTRPLPQGKQSAVAVLSKEKIKL